jgi:hypothetical protein
MASRKGRPSMSPVVPPISVIKDVHVLSSGVNPLLDLVGDVRDHLHGLPEVDPSPLLLDHALIDLARAQAVKVGEAAARETLVVPKVQVGLRAILKDVDLAVLVRAHRARVHVQVRVKLLYTDGEAPELKQCAKRRRGQALSERRNNSARHEDVFHPRGLNAGGRVAQDSSNPIAPLPEKN